MTAIISCRAYRAQHRHHAITREKNMKPASMLFGFVLLTAPAFAQHSQPGTAAHSPYAGLEARRIKALSDQQIEDLNAGRGMSLALPAELNGYPGPSHVLEMAGKLELTPEQLARTRSLFAEMQAGAVTLGARLIESERLLDALFAQGVAAQQTLAAAIARSGLLQGELRALHLKYHLETRDLLTPGQRARYNELRGYRGTTALDHRPATH
jgi:Spy/CpxP family protein refolding chaperone